MNILVQGALRYRLFYPVPKARAFGTTSGVPVTITGTKGQFEPVPLAVFLIVGFEFESWPPLRFNFFMSNALVPGENITGSKSRDSVLGILPCVKN